MSATEQHPSLFISIFEFRDDYKPIPAPRTKKPLQAPIPIPRTKKPSKKTIPEKRTIISQVEKALKGYTQSFEVELRDEKDPLVQLQKSRKAIENLFKTISIENHPKSNKSFGLVLCAIFYADCYYNFNP